ncbi:hypothetical protein [Agromyces bauzanensis]|uniref:hypothetical protein n=1 Tax=Agromyces bauzanensis TaxID=1308924 RepID=UPI00166CC677|nr:hypothetical protein [Agromyces bauzanensis]
MPPLLAVVVGLIPGVLPFVALALGEQLGWSSFVTARLSVPRSGRHGRHRRPRLGRLPPERVRAP